MSRDVNFDKPYRIKNKCFVVLPLYCRYTPQLPPFLQIYSEWIRDIKDGSHSDIILQLYRLLPILCILLECRSNKKFFPQMWKEFTAYLQLIYSFNVNNLPLFKL